MSANTFTLEAAAAANIQVVGSDKGSQAVHDLIVAYQANRRTGSANVEALYSRAVTPWWELVGGVKLVHHAVTTHHDVGLCRAHREGLHDDGFLYGKGFLGGDAMDVLYRRVGVDEAYREAGHMFYTVESHISYLTEARDRELVKIQF